MNTWNVDGRAVLLGGVLTIAILAAAGAFAPAQAQSGAGGGLAGGAPIVVGTPDQDEYPVFLLNASEQSLTIYEYDSRSEDLTLHVARSYRFDSQLNDYHNKTPDVKDVEKKVKDQK
jgi:hypothetical protein